MKHVAEQVGEVRKSGLHFVCIENFLIYSMETSNLFERERTHDLSYLKLELRLD